MLEQKRSSDCYIFSTNDNQGNLESPVVDQLKEEKQQDYFRKILSDIENNENTGQTVYPSLLIYLMPSNSPLSMK